MRLAYFAPVLILAFSVNAVSGSEAIIKFGPRLEQKMEMDVDGSISAPLEKLQIVDESHPPVCFEGKKRDACALLAAAVTAKNEKEQLPTRVAYEMTYCDFDERGSLTVDIVGAGGAIELPAIPPCEHPAPKRGAK